jgi:hypothetical protein
MTPEDLRRHLIASHLAGEVQTSPANTLRNSVGFVSGDEDYTFGLSDWRDATVAEVVQVMRDWCGADLPVLPNPDDPPPLDDAGLERPGTIDPDATLAAIEVHRKRLAEIAAEPGARVLIATAHPNALLPHYQALARALQAVGVTLVTPIEGRDLGRGPDGKPRELRYLDGVACLSDGASLRHSHRSRYMEAALDAIGGGVGTVDLVVADHGFAGAAIERGLPTLSIADVNDVPLPLAQARGRTRAVLPIDDNVPPRLFVPVTEAILAW